MPLRERLKNMYKDSSKPDKVKVPDSARQSWTDVKNGFLDHKNYFTAVALILTTTGLFLSIETDDLFLKRAQALLLFVSIGSVSVIIISAFKTSFRGKHPELYYAFATVFLWISMLLIVNLFGYLFSNFGAELLFYLKWL